MSTKFAGLPWEWDGNGNHIHPMGIPIVNLVGNPMGIRWEFLWESSGNSYGNPMGDTVGNPVGIPMGILWKILGWSTILNKNGLEHVWE